MTPPKRHALPEALSSLPSGSHGRVVAIEGEVSVRRQLSSMGIVEGTPVRVIRRALLGGTVLVAVGPSQYALGREIARAIRVARA